MKKHYLSCMFITTLLSLSSLHSQSKKEINQIRGKYNLTKLQSLKETLQNKSTLEKQKALAIAKQKGWESKITTKDGRVLELQKVVDGKPVYYTTFNVDAAASTRTDHLHSGGSLGLNLMGQNMTAYVWDGGLARSSHQEYDGAGGNNRYSIGDGTSTLNFHAAHVTGTIIASGVQADAKGMAPYAAAVGHDWNSDTAEATDAAANGMLVSNHSYGYAPRDQSGNVQLPQYFFGGYIDVSREWDEIMFNAPNYLMVVAAGNDGNDNSATDNPTGGFGFDKLTGHATSKNNLVVANANDANVDANGNLISVVINSSSSEGPTDDFRIKPDITGNGTNVYSTYESSNTAYASITGTSMASPNVTGSLLVLQQHYNNVNGSFMKAATLKGLALHTADDAGTFGPDAVFGWGLLNAKNAAETISDNGSFSKMEELTLSQGETYTITVDSDGSNPLLASISWTDRPGVAVTSENSTTPVLVNDIDIRVSKDGVEYLPYELTGATTNTNRDNDVDPFERIDLSGASGTYTITVTHKGTLTGGSQDFSLIVTGITEDGTGNPDTPDTCESLPYSESFESGDGWIQSSSDDGNWVNDASGTPSSNTGPSAGADGSNYMFLEASSNTTTGAIGSNATAILESPCFDLSAVATATITFQNHMYGTSVGSLELEASTNGSSWTSLWSLSGDQGNQWNEESVSLSSYVGGTVQLRFVGTTGTSWSSDIAIDAIEVTASGGSTVDTSEPTTPSNIVVSSITETTATISWSASSDNVGVSGYNVYNGSSLLGQVTGTSASLTGLTAGTSYTYNVTAFDVAGNESSTGSVTFTTTSASTVDVTYCDSEGSNTSDEWIDYVSFEGINNTTGDDGGYADYTNNVATVSLGSTNSIVFSCGFSGTAYTEYWAIWIDFNQDGVFDDSEKVVSGSSSSADNLSSDIVVPSTASLGTTRMRVSMKYNAAQTSCETFSYGEVEDYTVNIVDNSFRATFATTTTSTETLGNEASFVFKAYPNPVTDFFQVNIKKESASYKIINTIGQLVKKGELLNGNINVSDLDAGIYLLDVNDGQKSFKSKLIKK